MHTLKRFRLLLLLSAVIWGCGPQPEPLFVLRSPQETGVDFANTIVESDSFNILTYVYIYNGAGVAVGDLNNDGLTDLFFAGNQVSARAYLNQGDMRFTDITTAAGLTTTRWSTGTALVDINQDGWLDIYVCTAHPDIDSSYANYLFVNQGAGPDGVPVFREEAATYGLDDRGYSTQAAFFDYDRDGDLDCYVLTNSLEKVDRNTARPVQTDGSHPSTDRLYRNEGNGTFRLVSQEAGITTEGWGLGLVVVDVNQDDWPDLYVANDFLSSDFLWVNNGDGTFTNQIRSYLDHTSYNGMGADIADFNNDCLPDIVVLDMMPEDNRRQKSMFPKPSYDRFQRALEAGYMPQFVRNTLQLNNGDGTFSEIGQMAGIYKTDWSWTPLLMDVDNDGLRDLIITNGYHRDITDLDYAVYSHEASMFGAPEAVMPRMRAMVADLEGVKKHNYIYHNQGNLTFADRSAEWGFTQLSYSNGTTYADLDDDGDLDLVINNLNDPAMIYENRARQLMPARSQYLRVALHGPPGNLGGLGAKLTLTFTDSSGQVHRLYHEHQVFRGYKSTVDRTVHFGLGAAPVADALTVRWPDGRVQTLTQVRAGQRLILDYAEARPDSVPSIAPAGSLALDTARVPGLAVVHQETDYNDFNRDKLLFRKYSQEGPGLASADVNGDGRYDLVMGGSAGYPTQLFLADGQGGYQVQALDPDAAAHEDLGLLFFDADQDGDPDLYISSGGSEKRDSAYYYLDRFYRNEGGRLRRDSSLMPPIRSSGSVVTAADYDQDGDLDLFVGGRLRPGAFPLPPRSYILRNDGATFSDQTAALCPDLAQIGMVTSALWTDFDADGQLDLLVVGEWMRPTFLRQVAGRLVDVTDQTGLEHLYGWWNSLLPCDPDGDGDLDYALGNWGLNHRFHASAQEPVCVYAKDFDGNGSIDPVLCHYIQGENYPAAPRDALLEQMLFLRRRFPRYAGYGQATFDQVFTPTELAGALVVRAEDFRSGWLENQGGGRFAFHAFPAAAQVAPVYGMQAGDFDGDGHEDLLLVGNFLGTDSQVGWLDALHGLWLRGDGRGGWTAHLPAASGFRVDGDAKALITLPGPGGGPLILAARNRGPLAAHRPHQAGWRYAPAPPLATQVTVRRPGGGTRLVALPYGSGYLSQSARVVWLAPGELLVQP